MSDRTKTKSPLALTDDENFTMACKLFELFTPEEKARVLQMFVVIRQPIEVRDRFFEAVYRVVDALRKERK